MRTDILCEWKTKRYLIILFSLLAVSFLSGNVTFGADTGVRLSPYEMDLFHRINQYRVRNGSNPLKPDNVLQGLARNHSRHMDEENCLSHDAFHERFEKCGRSHCVENVGWNSPTPDDQLIAWKKSEGHNTNLLNRRIRFAGVSKVGAFVTFFACD